MSNLIAPKLPPFLFTYWNPFNKDSHLVSSWFDYVKDVTVAKYAADSVGKYIQQASADQIKAIDFTGKKICGELYTGFAGLESQLSIVSNQLSGISETLQGIDSRLGLLLDEAKTSNLLLENVAELLRIPDSQKQRQHHVEMGLKFLKNALKDEDLYQDALSELLEAEKLMPSDYFVLHRIGMIYLYVPALGNLEKAVEYFTKAGKYAAVESDPKAIRLCNLLNKRVDKKFNEQTDASVGELTELAGESFLQAGTAHYAAGQFDQAVKLVERAVQMQPSVAKHRFFLAKYQAKLGNVNTAVQQLATALEIAPETALASIADFDLNKEQLVLDLLNRLDTEVNQHLRSGIELLSNWPVESYQYLEVSQLVTNAQHLLEKGNYAEKVSSVLKLKEWPIEWEQRQPVLSQLDEIASYGIQFDSDKAVQLLRQADIEKSKEAWKRRNAKYVRDPRLRRIASKNCPTFAETVLLATADDQLLEHWDETLIQACIGIIKAEKKANSSLLYNRLNENRRSKSDNYYNSTDCWHILDELENRGVVGPEKGVGQRDILLENDLSGESKAVTVINPISAVKDFTFKYWNISKEHWELNGLNGDESLLTPTVSLLYDQGKWHLDMDRQKIIDGRYLFNENDYFEQNRLASLQKSFAEASELEGDGEWKAPPKLWTTMLKLIYGGKMKKAFILADQVWPKEQPNKEKFLADFKEQLSTSPYYEDILKLNAIVEAETKEEADKKTKKKIESLLNQAREAEAKEKAKLFGIGKNLTRVREFYSQAAALGSDEAAKKLKTL